MPAKGEMREMKRILFVMLSLYNGGAEKSLVNLLNQLPADLYQVDLLLFRREGMFLRQVPETVRILDTPKALEALYAPVSRAGVYAPIKTVGTLLSRVMIRKDEGRSGFRWRHFYSKVQHKLEGHYDIAVAYIDGEPAYYVDDFVDADKKMVWVHTDYRGDSENSPYDADIYRKFDAIATVSEGCADALREEFPSLAGKIYNIPNITSASVVRQRADEFVPEEFPENVLTILSIGRLSEEKGFDMALKAAQILKERGYRFHWFIVGDGPLESELKHTAATLQVKDCVTFLGARENPYPYIKCADIFVQTSRFEGKSVVLDEAKILGKPIVVTNYNTVADQITQGRDGVVVELSPEGIAAGIAELLDNPGKREQFQRFLSVQDLGNEDQVEKYITLFETV